MELLNEHYPVDVVQDSSGDEGPRICALIRNIDDLRDGLADATDLLHEQAKALRQAREALVEIANIPIKGSGLSDDWSNDKMIASIEIMPEMIVNAREAAADIDAILNKEHGE